MFLSDSGNQYSFLIEVFPPASLLTVLVCFQMSELKTIPCRSSLSQVAWPVTFVFHWKKWGKVFSLGAVYYCPQNTIERACLEKWGPHFDPHFETIDFQVSEFSHVINLSIFAEFCLYPKMSILPGFFSPGKFMGICVCVCVVCIHIYNAHICTHIHLCVYACMCLYVTHVYINSVYSNRKIQRLHMLISCFSWFF